MMIAQKPEMTPHEEIKKIEDAICSLLTHMLRCDKAREKRSVGVPPKIEIVPWELIKIKTHRECQISRVLNDPVRNACKNAVRLLGERLFELGGTDLMEKVCNRAELRSRPRRGYRAVMMDKTWDGVGCKNGNVGWVA